MSAEPNALQENDGVLCVIIQKAQKFLLLD